MNSNKNYKNELKDKVVLITGGSQGIGKCMAIEFAKLGSKIIILSRTETDLKKVMKEIKDNNGICDYFKADVTNFEEVNDIFEKISQKYGNINVLINCAGIYGPIGLLENNNFSEWKQALEINVFGTINCTKQIIPIMKRQNMGKIINLCGGGVGSDNLKPNFSSYITSKYAIAGFTEVMSKELREYNIQINAISPGAVNTRFLDQVIAAKENSGKDFYEKSVKQQLDGGTPPEKAADLAIFLSTKNANFISGKIISAVWDEYTTFSNIENFDKKSLFTLRRIDNFKFKEI